MRKPKGLRAFIVALALLALSCEIEDEIRIDRDGSGTDRVLPGDGA